MVKEKQDLPPGMIIIERVKHEMFRVLKKRIETQAELKLTVEEFGLLRMLKMKKDQVIQQNMAETMGKDKSAILRLVNSLEGKELVKRVVSTDDKRKNYLMITGKGENVLEQYVKIEIGLIDELERGLSKSESAIFYRVIDRIKTNAEKL